MGSLRPPHCFLTSSHSHLSKRFLLPRPLNCHHYHQLQCCKNPLRLTIFCPPGFFPPICNHNCPWKRGSQIVCGVSSASQETIRQDKEQQMTMKSGSEGKVLLKVRLDHQVEFGESVVILGSSEDLGSWKNHTLLNWSEDGWICDLELIGDKPVEFKFVIVRKDGSLLWESGDNRVLQLPKVGRFSSVYQWSKTGEAVEMLPLDAEEIHEGDKMLPLYAEENNEGDETLPLDGKGINEGDETLPLDAKEVNKEDEMLSLDAKEINEGDETLPLDAKEINKRDERLPLDAEEDSEGDEKDKEVEAGNGPLVEIEASPFVGQWKGKVISFMRSNEHRSRESERSWDTSGLEGLALQLVEGDKNARNWWRKKKKEKKTL